MRRPAGEAAELINAVLTESQSPAVTLAELVERTGLPSATVRDNVKSLCKMGKVETSKDGHGTLWIAFRNSL